MKSRKMLRKRLGAESGQALVESAIMCALLGLTWFLLFFASFMGNHLVRCAVGARHAAWSMGNGRTIETSGIASAIFFTNTDLVTLTPDTDSPPSGSDLGGALDAIIGAVLSIFPPIHTADVSFGVEDPNDATQYPFYLMNTQFPFMPETQLPFTQVQAHSAWDSVDETWDTIGGILRSIINGIAGTDVF